jgi:predicted ATPase
MSEVDLGFAVQLLERESQPDQLAQAFAGLAAGGMGVCTLISGDSGIGKTTLVQAFVHTLQASTPPLQCGCEALFTPRPLGPWVDIAAPRA